MKPLPFKIQKKQALNIGHPEHNSLKIKILDEDPFEKVKFIANQSITKDKTSTLYKEFGEDCRFHYRIEVFDGNERNPKLTCGEIGIGCLTKEGDDIFLNRISPRAYQSEDGQTHAVTLPQPDISQHPEQTMIISSVYPENIFECIFDSNSIIFSNEHYPLNPLTVEDNSLVGRKDGEVTNVSFSYLFDCFLKYLDNTKKKLSISVKQLVLSNSEKPAAKEGSIAYDKSRKQIKYYDGSSWKFLSSEE